MKNEQKFYIQSKFNDNWTRFKDLTQAKRFATKCRLNLQDHIKVYNKDMILLCEKLPNDDHWTDVLLNK